jgi:outer membrane protein OmpA-like peptidoglycan-associated protein
MLYLNSKVVALATLSFGICGGLAVAQAPNPTQQRVVQNGDGPVFRVSVVEYVERTTNAVNYRHRGGATKVDFEGTPLLKKAKGEAKVESKQGYIEIEVEFDDLTPATQFGPEYLTYVMWAITPEGRATNLGELLLNGDRGKLNVTTELQAFGMVVTAEPYFAVSQPSDVVVIENVIRPDTEGKVETINAKYELLKRGSYTKNVSAAAMPRSDDKTPLELREAHNAINLARAAGADRDASDTFNKAVRQLAEAETDPKKVSKKPAIMAAREAVQTAEDARLIALQRQDEARLAEERRIAQERTTQANTAAAAAAAQAEAANNRAAAEAEARRNADLSAQRAAAERNAAQVAAAQAAARAESDAQARANAEQARMNAEREAQRAAAQKAEAEAARLAAENSRAAAETARAEASREADRLERERGAAETARAQAVAAQEAAQRDAQQARDLAAKADQERAELRGRLQQQLNLILETKQTARGLIVNMSDVLFDVGRYTLKPGAREKLSKVAGILSAHPDLTLQVEGHTDSTGSDETNQKLSDNRAIATRDFLIQQGISAGKITAKGFGESLPVATNDTAAGRQQNRRVELIIAGESIQTSQR